MASGSPIQPEKRSPSLATINLPKYETLSAQTTLAIRQALAAGMWKGHLPSERRLCSLFQVSRPTVRAAVTTLAQEGLLQIRARRRPVILVRARRTRAGNLLVVTASHHPLSEAPMMEKEILLMLAELARQGLTSEKFECGGRTGRAQLRRLKAHLRENDVNLCLLLSARRETQAWFFTHAIPALVLGSCHTGIGLPSIDVDYRAVCRHAVGVFRRYGHRNIALIVPNSGAAGDLASEVGFREGAALRSGLTPVEARVVRHDGTSPHLTRRLDALFQAVHPPTALLVAKPTHVFSVVFHLLARGITVPGMVSLIARDPDRMYVDAITHYSYAPDAFARRVSRLVLQLNRQGHLPPEPNLIFPRYIPARSVRSLP